MVRAKSVAGRKIKEVECSDTAFSDAVEAKGAAKGAAAAVAAAAAAAAVTAVTIEEKAKAIEEKARAIEEKEKKEKNNQSSFTIIMVSSFPSLYTHPYIPPG